MPGLSHNLTFLYDGLNDDQLIEALSSAHSLRRLAKDSLGRGREQLSAGYHGAFLYYLRTRRPAILKRLDDEARDLVEGWPHNYSRLGVLNIRHWWNTALKERFRRILRDSMLIGGNGTPASPWIYKPAKAWVDALWPTFLEIHRTEKENIPPTMADVDRITGLMLHLPTAIYLQEYEDPALTLQGKRKRTTFVGKFPLITPIRRLLKKLVRDERQRFKKLTMKPKIKRAKPKVKPAPAPAPHESPQKSLESSKPLKLTPTMKTVLLLVVSGSPATAGCRGRSEFGGRETICIALRKRGLMRGTKLTAKGQKLAESLAQANREAAPEKNQPKDSSKPKIPSKPAAPAKSTPATKPAASRKSPSR